VLRTEADWSLPMFSDFPLSRREMLRRTGAGFGSIGLASLLAGDALAATATQAPGPLSPRAGHFPGTAKRVIFLFMTRRPSHVDTFDPKPGLEKFDGEDPPAGKKVDRAKGKLMKSPFAFKKYGKSGIDISELYPEVAKHADDLCVIRSMHHETPAHERALL